MQTGINPFLEAIFGTGSEGFIEIRPIGTQADCKPLFFKTVAELCDSLERIKGFNSDGGNIYFGTCRRNTKKGSKDYVKEVRTLWVDIDCDILAKSEAIERASALPIKPSVIVDSGNGIHLYWLLDKAVEPTPEIEAILKGLARALEGDTAVAELARVMRLPETLNVKDPLNPKPCSIISFDPDRRYSLSEFSKYMTTSELMQRETLVAFQGPPADPQKMIEGCLFIQHCRDNASSLEEPLWYAMISNLARCEGGVELVHQFSKAYPEYSPAETEAKIAHALGDTGPHTCARIVELGFRDCPEGGCGVKAPIVLGTDRRTGLRKKVEEATWDNYAPLLKQIAKVNGTIEKELLIQSLAERLSIGVRTVRSEISKLADANNSVGENENVLIAHPSYEINEHFMSLGLKETAIVGNRVEERNFYVVSTESGMRLSAASTMQLGGSTVYFNDGNRVLLDSKGRWDKRSIKAFLDNPAKPIGLYEEIKGVVREYLELTDDAHYGLLASYIIATYFNRCFNAFPYIFFYGKKQSGKSRALDFMSRLVMNGIKVQEITAASLGDSLDALRGSILVDQAESLSDPRHASLLGTLADGYTRDGGKRRVVQITNKSRSVLEFETYGPKVFASYKNIDPDLKDRCILITMLRALDEYPFPEAHLPIWKELRDKLYRLALTNWREVISLYANAGEGVVHRVKELWRPIETILMLENVSEDEKNAVKTAFLESMQETQVELSELEESVFSALFELLGAKEERILAVQEIVNEIVGKVPIDRGEEKRLQTIVGSILSQLKLKGREAPRKTVSYDGRDPKLNCRAYVFNLNHVRDVFNRYRQSSGLSGQVVLSSTNTRTSPVSTVGP